MNEIIIILSIIFLPAGGFFLYQGINHILVGNIIEATIYMFVGLIFLFLGGLMVYACFNFKKTNKK